jgi:hypothetical protein
MEKLNLVKDAKDYYSAKSKPVITCFDEILYLSIPGKGEPFGKEFSEKASALYSVAYRIKKYCKNQNKDFIIPKLEGHWRVECDKPTSSDPGSEWQWKLMIRMPKYVNTELVTNSIKMVFEKKRNDFIKDVSVEKIDEGFCVSIMHLGPSSNETESVDKIEKFIEYYKLEKNGYYRKIYLSDPNRCKPEKTKVIIRQPVK